jgi:hypothetical protein
VVGRRRDVLELAGQHAHDRTEIHGLELDGELARIHAGQVEEIGRKLREAPDLALHRLDEPGAGLLVEILVGEQLQESPDREERRAELVRRVRDELLARVVELRQVHAHLVESPREIANLVVPMIDDRGAEVAARDALRCRLQAQESMGQHPCRGEAEDQREHERERRREEQTLPHQPHGRKRVRERRLEEHDRVGDRDGDVRIVAARVEDASALDLPALERVQRHRVPRDVPRGPRPGVGDHGERRLVLRQDAERDDPCVHLNGVRLDAVLPVERVRRQRVRERDPDGLELLQPRIDESPFEGRDDDHVGGPERPRDDPHEHDHDADADPARE